jgi:hypothetical protein
MVGKNPLYVSRQHGHSVETMWRTYSAWMDGAVESDIALIKQSMERDAVSDGSAPRIDQEHPTDARIKSQGWVSQLRKVVSVWSLGRLCQSICQYALALMS